MLTVDKPVLLTYRSTVPVPPTPQLSAVDRAKMDSEVRCVCVGGCACMCVCMFICLCSCVCVFSSSYIFVCLQCTNSS